VSDTPLSSLLNQGGHINDSPTKRPLPYRFSCLNDATLLSLFPILKPEALSV